MSEIDAKRAEIMANPRVCMRSKMHIAYPCRGKQYPFRAKSGRVYGFWTDL
jgi:hypothetical protein